MEDQSAVYTYIEETLVVLIESSDISNARQLQGTLDEITSLWKEVTFLTQKQTDKLEKADKLAVTFDSLSNDLQFWLTRIEGSVSLFEAVSTILETIDKQKQQFKVSLDMCCLFLLISASKLLSPWKSIEL